MAKKGSIVFMDENLKPTTKKKAIFVRILEFDKNGIRREVFGRVSK